MPVLGSFYIAASYCYRQYDIAEHNRRDTCACIGLKLSGHTRITSRRQLEGMDGLNNAEECHQPDDGSEQPRRGHRVR